MCSGGSARGGGAARGDQYGGDDEGEWHTSEGSIAVDKKGLQEEEIREVEYREDTKAAQGRDEECAGWMQQLQKKMVKRGSTGTTAITRNKAVHTIQMLLPSDDYYDSAR